MNSPDDATSPMKVRIRYLGSARELTGLREEEVELPAGAALSEVAAWLEERYDLVVPSSTVMAALMGRGWDQLERGLGTELRDGDVIALFPPVGG